jgi:hypothetical protein
MEKETEKKVIDAEASPMSSIEAIQRRMNDRLKGKTPEEIENIMKEKAAEGVAALAKLRDDVEGLTEAIDGANSPEDFREIMKGLQGAVMRIIDIAAGDF